MKQIQSYTIRINQVCSIVAKGDVWSQKRSSMSHTSHSRPPLKSIKNIQNQQSTGSFSILVFNCCCLVLVCSSILLADCFTLQIGVWNGGFHWPRIVKQQEVMWQTQWKRPGVGWKKKTPCRRTGSNALITKTYNLCVQNQLTTW